MYIKEGNKFRLLDSESEHVCKNIEPGIYNIKIETSIFGENIHFMENNNYKNNKIVKVGVFKQAYEAIEDYFSSEGKEVRKIMNSSTRLGMLFEGSPGTGKTYLACSLAEYLVEKEKAICVLSNKTSTLNFKSIVDAMRRGNDPNQLIVFILDEFEKDYNKCDKEALLGFLDGTDSNNNIVVIATANDTSKLPATLTERPGRFELILDFKISDPDILKLIISSLLPKDYKEKLKDEVVLNMVKDVKEITIDKINKVITYCLTNILKGKPITDTIKKIKNNKAYENKDHIKKEKNFKIDLEDLIDDLDDLYEEGVYTLEKDKIHKLLVKNKASSEKVIDLVTQEDNSLDIDFEDF